MMYLLKRKLILYFKIKTHTRMQKCNNELKDLQNVIIVFFS